jgi:hypothetical protein
MTPPSIPLVPTVTFVIFRPNYPYQVYATMEKKNGELASWAAILMKNYLDGDM